MKYFIFIILTFIFHNCLAQKYIRPVFDRTDNYLFHLDSVEVTKDSTFLFFTYDAEGGSWAQISDKACIKDKVSGKEHRAISVKGIPFQPTKRHFSYGCKVLVIVSFESINKISHLDFIEDEQDSTAFNVWGIDLTVLNDCTIGTSSIEQVNALSSRVDFYVSLDDYKKAIELELQAMMMIKDLFGKESIGYAVSMMKLALFSWKLGNYQDAIKYGEQELYLCEMYYGLNHETFANSLTSLAGYYCEIGNYQKAMELDEQAITIRLNKFGDDSNEYAESLSRLANDYAGLGDIRQAISFLEKSIKIQETKQNDNEVSYIVSLNNLASFYSKLDDFESARSIESRVVQMAKGIYGENHSEYATYLGNLAQYELNVGKQQEALSLAKEVVQIKKNLYGTKHPHYRLSLNNLSTILFVCKKIDEAIDCLLECYESYKEEDDANDRIRYIGMLNNLSYYYACKNDFCNAVHYSQKSIELAKLYLTSSNNLRGNQKYLFWQQFNTMFDNQVPSYMINCANDSLASELFDLTLFSKGFSLKDDTRLYSYKDIQQKLKDGDLAIEMISPTMTINNQTSITLYALTVDKYHAPKLIRLFTLEEYDELIRDRDNKDSIIGNLVWKPILDEYKGIKNIFFSPTFILNYMGVEYMPVANYSHLSDKFNTYRLSSLRELVEPHERNQYKSATIYGDLNYNYVEEIPNNSKETRGSFDFLTHSKEEISKIASLLSEKRIQITSYTKEKGTEESFKRLSGQSPNIIHLATHGKYLKSQSAKEEQQKNNLNFIVQNADNGPMYEEDFLTHSFLLFSGGNRLIYRDSIPIGIDDGFLTAKEISELDLNTTDLVVLSACETALGEWSVDDGVLGLSRGFKRAGVNTILMSLNQVDDEATKILMVDFYKNLMSGKSKLQSLKDAQKYLRQVDNGKYDNPKYWAAFIMLDGLN